jgi:hypothetical protein
LRHLYSKFSRIGIIPEIIEQHTDVTLTRPMLLPWPPIIVGFSAEEICRLQYEDINKFRFRCNGRTIRKPRCAIIVT